MRHRVGSRVKFCLRLLLGFALFGFNDSAWSSEIAAPFFPLHPGHQLTYRENNTATDTATTLNGTTLIEGIATTAVQESDGFTAYYTNDANGIRLHRQVDPVDNLSATYAPPIVFANATMDVGQTVNSSGTAFTNLGNAPYSASFTVQAFETITVPLRSFDVVRVAGVITIAGGGSVSATIYLARNVGPVKIIENDGIENIVSELTATNVTPACDFDADVKADIGIYRDGVWSILRSSDNGNTVVGLGGPEWTPVPADYDGDGKTDNAVYLNGTWVIVRSSDGQTAVTGAGGPGFVPVPADYDGDSKADIAVYSGGVWSILRSSDGGNSVVAHGGPGWLAVPADYDRDGKTDIAVYLGGAWSILRSSDNGNTVIPHGGPAWQPVAVDYDGDGKADTAVYAAGAWSIVRSSDGGNTVVGHGGPEWVPIPADYDGDGKMDVAVYFAGAWSILRSRDDGVTVVGHGGALSDVPLH